MFYALEAFRLESAGKEAYHRRKSVFLAFCDQLLRILISVVFQVEPHPPQSLIRRVFHRKSPSRGFGAADE